MATTLQKQLAALQASRNNELDLKAQKAAHAKSLLFESSIASAQSFDVLFDICYDGFTQLCALDPRFEAFGLTLFSRHSKTQDRNLLTAAQNRELSTVIESFLAVVGGRLLLEPAQMAVEWLIRRFRVHELNTEALVMTFLPHHLTPLFVTLLSILPSELPPSLRILHRYANARSNPPRKALVQAAIQNPSFFSSLSRHVLGVCKVRCHYQNLLSMWATIITQSVHGLLDAAKSGQRGIHRQRSDDVLTRVLPVLNETLALKNVPELIIGAHMTFIVVISKADLDDPVLDAILSTVALSLTQETCESALACLSLIAEQRSSIALPHRAWRRISRVGNLASHLERLSHHQSVQNLAKGLALGFVAQIHRKHTPESLDFLDSLMRSNLLQQSERDALIGACTKMLQAPKSDAAKSTAEIQKQLEDLQNCLLTWVDLNVHEASSPRLQLEERASLDSVQEAPAQSLKATFSQELLDKFSLLPARAQYESFLAQSSTLPFDDLLRAFESCPSDSKVLEDLLDLPVMGRTKADSSPLFFSFLARVWCSSTSIAARSTAFRVASEQVNLFKQKVPDLQFLIPYSLVGLADPARKVRRTAADLLLTLADSYDVEDKSKRDHMMIYGKDTPKHLWVTKPVAAGFIQKCVKPAIEECVADESHIAVVLRTNLGSGAAGEPLSKEKRLRGNDKRALFSSFSTHTLWTNCSRARLGFLKLFAAVSKVDGEPRSIFLIETLKDFVTHFDIHSQSCKNEGVDLVVYTSHMLKIVVPSDSRALKYLYALATSVDGTVNTHLRTAAFGRVSTLWSRLPDIDQKTLVIDYFRFAQSQSTSQVDRSEAVDVLRQARLQSDALMALVNEAIGSKQQSPSTKRQRVEGGKQAVMQNNQQSDQNFLAGLTLAMEISEDFNGAATVDHLRAFFQVLQELQNYNARTNSDLAYLTNLTLSVLSKTIRGLNPTSEVKILTTQIVRPDLLVDCVRDTNSSQTRNSALLLLSELARVLPQAVLHSAMPIFTMMSATTARLSDDFSAHVVDQTIKEVVPVIVHELHKQQKDPVSATTEILHSFAASFDHIPPHRRLQLFRLLGASLGANESLFAIIATLSDRFPDNSEVSKFASTLFIQFGSSVSLWTVNKTLELIKGGSNPPSLLFRSLIKDHTSESGCVRSMLNLIRTVSTLLKDSTFQASLKLDLGSNGTQVAELEQLLRECFENIFKIFNNGHQQLKLAASPLLEQILLLFHVDTMAQRIEPLLAVTDEELCQTALAALEKQIRTCDNSKAPAKSAVLDLLPYLVPMLETDGKPTLKAGALACIDQICEKFGRVDKAATLNAARVVAGKSCLECNDFVLQALSFHCLASAVEILQNEFIPILKPVENATFSSLEACMEISDSRLHNAVFAYLLSLVDNLPFMLSEKFLRQILRLAQNCTLADLGDEARESRRQFLKLISTKVDLPIVTRSALHSWHDAVQGGPKVLSETIYLIESLVQSRPKSEMCRSSKDVFGLLQEVLDFRSIAANFSSAYSPQKLETLEEAITSAVVEVVLKVNDKIFRPFFIQLAEWSASPVSRKGIQASQSRTVTLFDLTFRLSERLKSIFTAYFGHVLDRASQVLQDASSTLNVRRSVIRALTSSFTHDQDDFWQRPSHFESILGPLVSQLSSSSMQTASQEVMVAITELGAAASSNEHYKAMNSLLLNLCRNDSSRTRLAAVKCQQKLTERLGDEWLSNLPEILPRINELQEDDDEEVERETHKWIKLVEDKLGESLNSMLQ